MMQTWAQSNRDQSANILAGIIILVAFIISGCSATTILNEPTKTSPQLTPTSDDNSINTPLTTQKLRITNQGALPIQHLVVRFPEDKIDFGDVLPGMTTNYLVIPHGVYRYAAYDVEVNGQKYQQPVVDWIGETPMQGESFIYTIEADPSRWQTEGQVIKLVQAREDQSTSDSTPSPTQTPDLSSLNTESADFLLTKGTSWIYSYDEYEPTQTDPTKVTSATYQFTETVVDTVATTKYFVAHIHRDEQFVKADPDWVLTESSRPKEFWYIVSGQQVFESFKQPDLNLIQLDSLILVFDFPFSVGKSWCPKAPPAENKECISMGKKTVASKENYEAPFGTLNDCYQINEDVNSGGVTRWFCKGVGIAAQKYEHGGTRFGFTQVLIGYTKGPTP